MKRIGRIMLYMWLPAIIVAGCDDEKEGAVLPDESRPEVIVVGNVDSFVQTRAAADVGNINADGLGAKYGDIYIRQREYNASSNGDNPVTVTGWGKYKVKEGAQGILEYTGEGSSGTGSGSDGGSEDKGLTWGESDKAYVFQVLNIPQKTGEAEPAVTIDMAEKDGRVEGTGTVTFGGGTGALASGLEYFVGGGVGPKTLVKDGQSISMTLRRQVAKVLFSSIERKKPGGATDENIQECTIIFPNLPKKATFSFDEFHKEVAGNMSGEITLANPNERIGDYVQLHVVGEDGGGNGVELNWKLHAGDDNTSTFEDNIVRAAYLIPFKFLKDNGNGAEGGSENKQLLEEQPGFFIVKLPIDGSGTEKVYTGNILGTDQYHNLRAGHYAVVELTLVDGTEAGGTGSIIQGWHGEAEADVPHHPVPGVYTEEEIGLLLEALKSGDADKVPKTFYDDKEKVIRLFTNIDWSKAGITELKIPEGFVLDGQGYNIKLGADVEITGGGKLQDIYIYINGKLTFYDGTTTSDQAL